MPMVERAGRAAARPRRPATYGRTIAARLTTTAAGVDQLLRSVEQGGDEFILASVDGRTSIRVAIAIESVDELVQRLGGGRIAVDWSRATISNGRDRVSVTRTELRLLNALLERGGGIVPRATLIARTWPRATATPERENALAVYVCTLRKRLTSIGLQNALRTVRGIGYRMTL